MDNLRQFNMFLVLQYIEPCFTATIPAVAPRMDLSLLQDVTAYSSVSKEISNIAKKAFIKNLWYLTPVNVAIAFFDDQVSTETKLKMV